MRERERKREGKEMGCEERVRERRDRKRENVKRERVRGERERRHGGFYIEKGARGMREREEIEG